MNNTDIKAELAHILSSHPYYSIVFDGNYVCHLNRWLVTSAMVKGSEFSKYPLYNQQGKVLSPKEAESMEEDILEKNWRFYVSGDINWHYKRNCPEKMFSEIKASMQKKLIYCLCCIYCDKGIELLLHVSTMFPAPLKMWINGELVFISTAENIKKNHILSFRFESGINSILIEKSMHEGNRKMNFTPRNFSVSIRPKHLVVNGTIAKILNTENLLDSYLMSDCIYTDKLFYNKDETVKVIVLPNSYNDKIIVSIEAVFSDTSLPECHTVTVRSVTNIRFKHKGSCIVKLSIPNNDINGYIFIGDFEQYTSNMEKHITNSNLQEEDKLSLIFNLNILNRKKGLVYNSIEPIHQCYSQPVFEKLYHLDNLVTNGVTSNQLVNGFNTSVSKIDGMYLNYYLSVNNASNKPVPLFVCFNYDDSMTRIPISPNKVMTSSFDNAVTLVFCGRGDYTNDYLNEYDMINVIKFVINRYNIDKRRVYLYGICTGVRRGFEFIKRNDNLFAAMLAFAGTWTRGDDLAMKRDTIIQQICNLDDIIYNGAAVIKNANLFEADTYIVSGYEHEELIDYYCNKNLCKLMLKYNLSEEAKFNESIIKEKSIRNIYLDPCFIVLDSKEKHDGLTILLSQPINMRARNYNYKSIFYNPSIDFSVSNYIFYINASEYNDPLPDKINMLYMNYTNEFRQSKTNNYFIIAIEANPLNCNKKILFVIYSGTKAKQKLFELWKQFDSSPMFDMCKIIFKEDGYLQGH